MLFGLFGLRERSKHQQILDDHLRASGVHPQLVPEEVKLTVLKFVKAGPGLELGSKPNEPALAEAGRLLAYCFAGREEYVSSNGPGSDEEQERRLALALEAGEGIEARIVMLALASGIAHDSIAARFDLETGEEEGAP